MSPQPVLLDLNLLPRGLRWTAFLWWLRRCRMLAMLFSIAIMAGLMTDHCHAQGMSASGPNSLLDHRVPPGVWGEWIQAAGRVRGFEFQSVRVELPSTGQVTWFVGSFDDVHSGGQVGLAVGQSYRVRLSEMPEFPGIELYPSIEMLDRLHPPPGYAESFPVPVTFAVEELEAVIEGRMITKVVYLEQPQLAAPFELTADIAVRTVNSRINLIEEADKAGRPLALIRLGGRLPARNETSGPFFGSGAPLLPSSKGSTVKRGHVQQAVTFAPAEPRVQLTSQEAAQELTPKDSAKASDSLPKITASPKLAEEYPDEYLFDGGDRGYPVHYDRDFMLGVDAEDTIAEYRDDKGRRHVKASNRVAIYAPRFAGLRSVSGMREDFNVQRVASNFDQVQGAGLQQRANSKTSLQRERLQGVRMRSRAGGLLGKTTRDSVASSLKAAQNSKLLNLFEDVQFFNDGRLRQSESARLQAGMQAAIAWSRDLNPVMVASLSAAQEVYATFKVAELVGVDESHKKPGRLRIVKLADKESAKPGDVITFMIRFDNLGDRELQHIRIIDNLTPRLVYIDDSVTSDQEGSINVDDNAEGSHILRFEFDKPLAGHTGGVVSFQARLR